MIRSDYFNSFHRPRGHHGFGCDVGDGHVPGGEKGNPRKEQPAAFEQENHPEK